LENAWSEREQKRLGVKILHLWWNNGIKGILNYETYRKKYPVHNKNSNTHGEKPFTSKNIKIVARKILLVTLKFLRAKWWRIPKIL